jgi:hypothetical protein
VSGEVATPPLVNSLKLRVLQEPLALRESLLGFLRSRIDQGRLQVSGNTLGSQRFDFLDA